MCISFFNYINNKIYRYTRSNAITQVGRHRRVKFEDVIAYKRQMKAKQEKLITKIIQADEESGLYDI